MHCSVDNTDYSKTKRDLTANVAEGLNVLTKQATQIIKQMEK